MGIVVSNDNTTEVIANGTQVESIYIRGSLAWTKSTLKSSDESKEENPPVE